MRSCIWLLGELVLGDRSLKEIDSTLQVDQGKLTFDLRATGAQDGTLQTSGTLVPASDGTVDLDMKVDLSNVRATLASEGVAPAGVPPLSVAMNIRIHGSSPRQMAAGANGHLLLTQSAGQTKSGFISAYGGDFVQQLAHKLNPFAKDDPFMKLDCTIARADIVNGQVTVKPILLQSEKVTVTAHGTIDLHTEKLLLDFNTRPRKGIGVSPGMFTNPLIRLEGTLMESEDGSWCEGCGVGCGGGGHRRNDGGRGRPGRSNGRRKRSVWQDARARARNPAEQEDMTNFRIFSSGLVVTAVFALHGCYTAPTPVAAPPTRSISERFEQSWQAARGAVTDVGVSRHLRRSCERDAARRTGRVKSSDLGDHAGRCIHSGRIRGDRRRLAAGREPQGTPDARVPAAHGALNGPQLKFLLDCATRAVVVSRRIINDVTN